MCNQFPVRRQKIVLPQFARQHPLHPLKRHRRNLFLCHPRGKKVNLDLLPKMRILMRHPRDLPAFRQRHSQLFAQLPRQRRLQRFPLAHLPARELPLQPGRIFPPPLPNQHPPVPPFDHRCHYLSHSSSSSCRLFGVRRLAAAFRDTASTTKQQFLPAAVPLRPWPHSHCHPERSGPIFLSRRFMARRAAKRGIPPLLFSSLFCSLFSFLFFVLFSVLCSLFLSSLCPLCSYLCDLCVTVPLSCLSFRLGITVRW